MFTVKKKKQKTAGQGMREQQTCHAVSHCALMCEISNSIKTEIRAAIIITLSSIKQNHELAFFISFITESVTHAVNFSCCLPMNRKLSHENSLCFATDSSLKIPKFFSKINYFKIETICYN